MSSLDSIFIKEFNKVMRIQTNSGDIFSVPLPEESKSWEVSGSELLGVNRIDSKAGLFKGLNGSLARKLPKNSVARKRKYDLVTKSFAKDSNGRFIYEDVKVPSGSMVILSSKNLNLPYKYSCEDKGFGYIDFISIGDKKEYLYYIPKNNLFKVHQVALALSVKNMKNFMGMGYQSWDYGIIYLHVIPYVPTRQYIGSKILKTSFSLDFSNEIRCIVDYWEQNNVIPKIRFCQTIEKDNLVLKPTQRGFEDYIPVEELSIGEKLVLGEDIDSENISE